MGEGQGKGMLICLKGRSSEESIIVLSLPSLSRIEGIINLKYVVISRSHVRWFDPITTVILGV